MNSQFNLKLILLVIIITISCKRQINNDLKTINVLQPEETGLNISEIADEINYVPLSSDSILAQINSICYSDGEYFISDNLILLRFNEKGELLNKIGSRGKGPGEYARIYNFIIQPDTREIFITGGKRDKMMVYSPNGDFIRLFNLKEQNEPFPSICGENILIFYYNGVQHTNENMELIDVNGNLIRSYHNKYKFKRGMVISSYSKSECLMYNFDHQLHFKEIFSDTIFYVEDQEIVPKVILDSGKKRFTPEIRSKIISEISMDGSSESEDKPLIQNNLFETKGYLFYSYEYDKKNRLLIYNKPMRKKIEIDNEKGIVNDWDGGPNFHLKMKKDNNTLLSWIDAYELKQYVGSDAFKNSTPKYPKKKKQLEQLANSLDENDNPVLILLKLKK